MALAGLVVLGCAGGGWWSLLQVERQEQTLQTTATQLREQLRQLPVHPPPTPVEELLKRLPGPSQARGLEREITQAAEREGVQLVSLQFEPRSHSALPVREWRLNLSVQAPYPAAKALVAALLNRYPYLVLDNVVVQAAPADASRVDVKVAMSWWERE